MNETLLEIRVQPRAKRNPPRRVEVVEGGKLKVYVTAPPESGKANDAVIAMLSKRLKVSRSKIAIVRGHRGRDKVLNVQSMSAEQVRNRLTSE